MTVSAAISTGVASLAEVRVRVREPAARVRELMTWIGEHEAVESVRHDPVEGTIVVRFDDRRAPPSSPARGGPRTASARICPVPKVEACPANARHDRATELTGRVRFRATGLPPAGVERLASFVATLEGADRTRASPAPGSVLGLFEPGRTDASRLLAQIVESLPTAWPACPPRAGGHGGMGEGGVQHPGPGGRDLPGVVPAPAMLCAVAITADSASSAVRSPALRRAAERTWT